LLHQITTAVTVFKLDLSVTLSTANNAERGY
jgi:hypothetical protein